MGYLRFPLGLPPGQEQCGERDRPDEQENTDRDRTDRDSVAWKLEHLRSEESQRNDDDENRQQEMTRPEGAETAVVHTHTCQASTQERFDSQGRVDSGTGVNTRAHSSQFDLQAVTTERIRAASRAFRSP